MAVTMRKAGTADIAAIVSMQNDLASEGALWGYMADSAEEWNQRDLDWLLLAVDGSEPVGLIYCTERPYQGECVFSEGNRILEIVELYVRPEYRHAGVGRRMVDAVQSMAAASGFTHMRLYSAAKRFDDILAFYRCCGFAPWYLEMTKPV
jgi:GNAT superfamily N-acetyltransferase